MTPAAIARSRVGGSSIFVCEEDVWSRVVSFVRFFFKFKCSTSESGNGTTTHVTSFNLSNKFVGGGLGIMESVV